MKNILILFTDQFRYDAINALGNLGTQTPNLDVLANDGIVFDRCYTPSPVCIPARFSMYSGQYPARTGCNNNNKECSYSGNGYYARFTEAGFDTCAVGKMHHTIDLYGSMGFRTRYTQEEAFSEKDDYGRFIVSKHPDVFDYHGMRSEMYYVPQISPLKAEDHPSQWIADQCIEYIRNHNKNEGLFLVGSFLHPHPPYAPPAPWQKLYRDDPEPPFIPETLDTYKDDLIGDRCSLKRLEISRQDILRTKNFYFACVSFVDYQIGRIIKELKDSGLYDDTLILFSCDHGDMMGDYGAIGKRTMMDSSCRIPLIIRHPGKKHERRTDPCSLVDIAPTLLAYAGISFNDTEYDGINLFSGNEHSTVYSQFGCGENGTYMATDGRTKLIYCASSKKYYLFETVPDDKETYAEHQEQVSALKELLDNYRKTDVSKTKKSISGEPVSKVHPHYAGRLDHKARAKEEEARIPEGYHIDLS